MRFLNIFLAAMIIVTFASCTAANHYPPPPNDDNPLLPVGELLGKVLYMPLQISDIQGQFPNIWQ